MMPEENKLPEEEIPSSATTDEANALSAFEQVTASQIPVKKKRMNTNTRLLIVVTAIVAVLAILLAVLLPLLSEGTGNSSNSSDPLSTPEEVYPLYDRSKDDTKEKIVQAVTIKNEDDEYTIRYNKKESLYRLDGYADIALSEAGVEELTDLATTLNGYNKVKTVEKLADFGLDKPSITVTITYYDSTSLTLFIGNETPDKNGYYACLQDSDEVVMLDSSLASYFKLKKGQYVERTLIATPSVKSDDNLGSAVLKELTLKGGPNKETLSLRQVAVSDGEEFSYANFLITSPYKRMVDETVATSLGNFTYLIADEGVVLHPTAADKAKYGFNNPYAQLDVTLAVQSYTEDTGSNADGSKTESFYYNTSTAKVIVGSKDEYGNYYVMVDGSNAIYLVSSSSLSVVAERTYVNTISQLLFLRNIDNISQVSFFTGGKTYNFKLTHDSSKEDSNEQMTVTCDGKKLDTQNFRTLYSKLMGIGRYGETTVKPTGEPLHKIALYETDGSLFLSMDILAHSSSLYTVRTNEGELFTVKASDINNYMTQLKNYYDGKPVLDV